MAVFLLGSMLCGASRSLEQMVVFRILQGMGGALMTPVGRLIVVSSSPREQLVSAMGWSTMPALVGPLLGPPVAGLVLEVARWPRIFFKWRCSSPPGASRSGEAWPTCSTPGAPCDRCWTCGCCGHRR